MCGIEVLEDATDPPRGEFRNPGASREAVTVCSSGWYRCRGWCRYTVAQIGKVLRLPLQFATALEARLLFVDADDLKRLRQEAEARAKGAHPLGHHVHTPPVLGAAGDLTALPGPAHAPADVVPTGIGSAQASPRDSSRAELTSPGKAKKFFNSLH